jgi:cell division ATPase FtsA
MSHEPLTLFLEINNFHYIYCVGESDKNNNFKLIFKLDVPIKGIRNNRITDFDIKENIFLLEQKFNYTFREITLILENFDPTFINLTGFKRLNGSQILKENITYILNDLRSYLDQVELKKKIIHIFNSKFYLDNKEIENLPIGLFGDMYAHELSFILINDNDFKNLNNILDKCNLKLKKILIKSFIEGAHVIKKYTDVNSFLQIHLYENHSKILYFENNSFKFEQSFNFGNDIIIRDISKVVSLKKDTIKNILKQCYFNSDLQEDDLIEKDFFKDEPYRKIRKRLIFEIADARIKELSNKILFKNVNLNNNSKKKLATYLTMVDYSQFFGLKDLFIANFSTNNASSIQIIQNAPYEELIGGANEIVHFGWNKEAIPFTQSKKTIIAKFFDLIFN